MFQTKVPKEKTQHKQRGKQKYIQFEFWKFAKPKAKSALFTIIGTFRDLKCFRRRSFFDNLIVAIELIQKKKTTIEIVNSEQCECDYIHYFFHRFFFCSSHIFHLFMSSLRLIIKKKYHFIDWMEVFFFCWILFSIRFRIRTWQMSLIYWIFVFLVPAFPLSLHASKGFCVSYACIRLYNTSCYCYVDFLINEMKLRNEYKKK